MINSWSLLYDELNGTMDKTYPIENDELNNEDINITTGTGNTDTGNTGTNLRELPALPQGRWFTCALGRGSDANGVVRPTSRERFGRQFHRFEVPRLENATGATLGAGKCAPALAF